MENIIDRKAFNEIKIIINHLEPELQSKIPDKVIRYIEEHTENEYNYMYDENKGIDEQKMLDDTAILLSIIYKEYICTDEEKKELEKVWNINEQIYQKALDEKYNGDNLFNTRKSTQFEDKSEETSLNKYKENFLLNIINKVKEKIKVLSNKRKWRS